MNKLSATIQIMLILVITLIIMILVYIFELMLFIRKKIGTFIKIKKQNNDKILSSERKVQKRK